MCQQNHNRSTSLDTKAKFYYEYCSPLACSLGCVFVVYIEFERTESKSSIPSSAVEFHFSQLFLTITHIVGGSGENSTQKENWSVYTHHEWIVKIIIKNKLSRSDERDEMKWNFRSFSDEFIFAIYEMTADNGSMILLINCECPIYMMLTLQHSTSIDFFRYVFWIHTFLCVWTIWIKFHSSERSLTRLDDSPNSICLIMHHQRMSFHHNERTRWRRRLSSNSIIERRRVLQLVFFDDERVNKWSNYSEIRSLDKQW